MVRSSRGELRRRPLFGTVAPDLGGSGCGEALASPGVSYFLDVRPLLLALAFLAAPNASSLYSSLSKTATAGDLTITSWSVGELQPASGEAPEFVAVRFGFKGPYFSMVGLVSALETRGEIQTFKITAPTPPTGRVNGSGLVHLRTGPAPTNHSLRMKALARTIPPKAWLTRYEDDGHTLLIAGTAMDLDGLTQMMVGLRKSSAFMKPTLRFVKQAESELGVVQHFEITAAVPN